MKNFFENVTNTFVLIFGASFGFIAYLFAFCNCGPPWVPLYCMNSHYILLRVGSTTLILWVGFTTLILCGPAGQLKHVFFAMLLLLLSKHHSTVSVSPAVLYFVALYFVFLYFAFLCTVLQTPPSYPAVLEQQHYCIEREGCTNSFPRSHQE